VIFIIGIGGIAGAFARFYLGKWIVSKKTSLFPIGTFIINASGSFLLGLLYSLHSKDFIPLWVLLLLGTGFCGAYTTFSTFGYETVQLLEKKRWGHAVAYVLFSVVIGLLLAWAGMVLIR
jgi:fluoride exporter